MKTQRFLARIKFAVKIIYIYKIRSIKCQRTKTSAKKETKNKSIHGKAHKDQNLKLGASNTKKKVLNINQSFLDYFH